MRQRLPEWLKRGIVDTEKTRFVRKVLKEKHLNTVCDGARCPNKNECYSKKTATFMILGNICTRNCRFCSVGKGLTEQVNPQEPEDIAQAVKELGLDYVVITSVTRDDLEDGGATHFANTVNAVKAIDSSIKVEVLTPDFQGRKDLIDIVIQSNPDVMNHNVETVERLYSKVRPMADYRRSIDFISYIKQANPNITTKSGLMVGFGETYDELKETFIDLKNANCDIVTIGQYIQPTKAHCEVEKYLLPEEYEDLTKIALEVGIKKPVFGPLVRSSYNAKECFN